MRLQRSLDERLLRAALLQSNAGERAVHHPSLGIEIDRCAQQRLCFVKSVDSQVTRPQRMQSGRTQRVERNRLLQQFDRLVVAAEYAREARTRLEHIHVTWRELVSAPEFRIGGVQI